jgi:16S rRNA processing protein RimM
MNINDCYHLGYVVKPHGVKGEIQLMLDVDNPAYYKKFESVFLEINQKLVPFFISNIQISNSFAIIKFEDIDSFDQADELVSAQAYLPLQFLPPLEEGQFYYHQVIGYQVKDEKHGLLGEVEDIVSLPQHEIFVFRHQGKEVLAPLNDLVIKKVDHTNKVLEVSLPEGLLELYMDL